MHLKGEANEKYADGIEELVRFCEGHLIQGSVIEGEFLSYQIDILNSTAISVGKFFEEHIIPMTKICKCIELEELQEELVKHE